MELKNRIENLSDEQVVKLFRAFSNHLFKTTGITPVKVKTALPKELEAIPAIEGFSKADPAVSMASLDTSEAVVIARMTLASFADNPDYAPTLAEFMEGYTDREMAAGAAILSVGAVMTMILVVTSIKIERGPEGKINWSFDSSNISDNAVKVVEGFLSLIPGVNIKLKEDKPKE